MSKEPNWILSDDWAMGINPLNWIIYKRKNNKAGKPSGWKPVSYYPTADMALKALLDKIMLTDTGNPDMIEHINQGLRAATSATSAFFRLMEALPAVPDKKTLSLLVNTKEAA